MLRRAKAYHPQFHNIICGWCFIVLMFALPIYLSYHVSDGLQYYVSHWLTKLSQISLFQENKLQHILFGHYGVISLGTYSFVWALPVVFMISLSTALIDITHLKALYRLVYRTYDDETWSSWIRYHTLVRRIWM